MKKQIQNTLVTINTTERFSQENKNAWANLFRLAKTKANKLKHQTKGTVFERDIDPSIIVDQWLAEFNDAYVEHSSPQDDKLCDDISCVQALEIQAKQEAIDAIKTLYLTPHDQELRDTVRYQLAELHKGSNPNLAAFIRTATNQWMAEKAATIIEDTIKYTSCDITAYESFTDENWDKQVRTNIPYTEYESLNDLDQYADSKEYRTVFYQEEAIDPDDARFLGTPPKSDSWDDKMRSNFIDRKRGSRGVLNGLYENTLPEPSYRNKESKRTLMYTLLDSDNTIDIELGSWMTKYKRDRRKKLVQSRINSIEDNEDIIYGYYDHYNKQK